jgi:hypothetical protein
LQEVDPLNSEHIARHITEQIQNISTAAIIGPWHFEGADAQLSLFTVRLDIRGHLFAQLHRIQIDADDKQAIEELQKQAEASRSDSESDDGSQESDSSASSSRSDSASPDSNHLNQSTSFESSDESSSSSSEAPEGYEQENLPRIRPPVRQPPFKLKQLGSYHLRKRGKHLWHRKKAVLTKPSSELPNHDVYDASPLARLVYDPRPGYHPNDSYPKVLEERRLKSILECEGDYEKLKELVTTFSRRERHSYRAVKRRIDPTTQKLAPSETRFEDNPDWYDVSDYRRLNPDGSTGASHMMDESVDDENVGMSKEDGLGEDSEKTENAAPTGAKEGEEARFDRKRWMRWMRQSKKKGTGAEESEDDGLEHPARKRVLRRLPEDMLDLSQVQYEYFLENLEDVLRDIDAEGDWEEREVPPIDPRVVLDVFPIDRAAVERIVRRTLVVVLKPRSTALRTTAEMYRELVDKRLVHPLYFPPSFLRSILAFYVAKGNLDYVSLRGIQAPTEMMTDRYPSGTEKPWTLHDRIQSRDRDPYMHYLNLNDELDGFVLNPTGLMDVDAEYFIGQTVTPRHEPIPANREKSTVSEFTWRSPRLVYPPTVEEVITTVSSSAFPSQQPEPEPSIYAQASRLDNSKGHSSAMSSSQFMPPPTQPTQQISSQANMFGSQSLGTHPSIPLNRSTSLAFAPPSQTLSRQHTAAELRAERERIAARSGDLQSQQSQIMELLQTQQTIADIHKEQEMKELDEDKREETALEKLHAPANVSQLMAYLLHKWQADYDSFKTRVTEARGILRTIPRDES